jgi:hypothetical protein
MLDRDREWLHFAWYEVRAGTIVVGFSECRARGVIRDREAKLGHCPGARPLPRKNKRSEKSNSSAPTIDLSNFPHLLLWLAFLHAYFRLPDLSFPGGFF